MGFVVYFLTQPYVERTSNLYMVENSWGFGQAIIFSLLVVSVFCFAMAAKSRN